MRPVYVIVWKYGKESEGKVLCEEWRAVLNAVENIMTTSQTFICLEDFVIYELANPLVPRLMAEKIQEL